MTATFTPEPNTLADRDSFAELLHAEWTKFRTVRGWVAGIIIAGLLTVGINLIPGGECGQQGGSGSIAVGGSSCSRPLGPGGEAVNDSFYFVHQSLAGNGNLTVRMTSLASSDAQPGTPPQPWAKAGIIIKASTTQGSAYAAMMLTGSNGVRMQWDYTHDTPGLTGQASATAPRWLRLIRSGDTITGYDSTDGTHWTTVGTATLAGFPATVQAGLFATSPAYSVTTSQSLSGSSGNGVPTRATGTFDHVTLADAAPGSTWAGTNIGSHTSGSSAQGGVFSQSGGGFTVTGSGDIAPVVPGGSSSGGSMSKTLIGTFLGLIAVIVVAAMFITSEYRRGLIRVTLTASPRRNRALAAKAIVIGAVTFVVGIPTAVAALLTGERKFHAGGIAVAPVPTLTEVQLVVGTAALLAVAAVLALAIGLILRHGAAAVSAVIVLIVLPYFFAVPLGILPAGAAEWLLRVSPAAAFSLQQAYPQYPQVAASYTPANNYFPLAPWVGFAVLCVWAALALGLAAYLLRRRDA